MNTSLIYPFDNREDISTTLAKPTIKNVRRVLDVFIYSEYSTYQERINYAKEIGLKPESTTPKEDGSRSEGWKLEVKYPQHLVSGILAQRLLVGCPPLINETTLKITNQELYEELDEEAVLSGFFTFMMKRKGLADNLLNSFRHSAKSRE